MRRNIAVRLFTLLAMFAASTAHAQPAKIYRIGIVREGGPDIAVLPALLLMVVAVFARQGDAADGKRERDVHRLAERINEYRAQHRLPPLVDSAVLSELAHDHAAAMARTGRLSHDGFQPRFAKARSPRCVENVGMTSGTPETAFDGWRDSPPHARNLLDARITRMGIASEGPYVAFFACQ